MTTLRRIAELLWQPFFRDGPVRNCCCEDCEEERAANALKREVPGEV